MIFELFASLFCKRGGGNAIAAETGRRHAGAKTRVLAERRLRCRGAVRASDDPDDGQLAFGVSLRSEIDSGGYAKLFDNARAAWVLDKLGGVAGAEILELGPLEAGHTYMLDRAGAKSVVAVEGLKSAYLKCLVAKEVLGIKSAQFLLGNFVPWLEREARTFDLIWASGVLYHSNEPLKLLQLIAAHTEKRLSGPILSGRFRAERSISDTDRGNQKRAIRWKEHPPFRPRLPDHWAKELLRRRVFRIVVVAARRYPACSVSTRLFQHRHRL